MVVMTMKMNRMGSVEEDLANFGLRATNLGVAPGLWGKTAIQAWFQSRLWWFFLSLWLNDGFALLFSFALLAKLFCDLTRAKLQTNDETRVRGQLIFFAAFSPVLAPKAEASDKWHATWGGGQSSKQALGAKLTGREWNLSLFITFCALETLDHKGQSSFMNDTDTNHVTYRVSRRNRSTC